MLSGALGFSHTERRTEGPLSMFVTRHFQTNSPDPSQFKLPLNSHKQFDTPDPRIEDNPQHISQADQQMKKLLPYLLFLPFLTSTLTANAELISEVKPLNGPGG